MSSAIHRRSLDAAALRSAIIEATGTWQRIEVIDETGSTNADLLEQAAHGLPIAGAVLLAEYQRAGRGRHGRSWSAPVRSQIAMSVGVDTTGIPATAWGWLPLLTGVAVVDAMYDTCGVQAGLKWPNDVLVGTGKLAGILAEVAAPEPVIVVGVGLNVTLTEDELPDPAATSLLMLGAPAVDRADLVSAVLQALDARIKAWRSASGADEALLADYRRHSLTLGTRVRASLPGGQILTGHARDIDAMGRLIIDDGTASVTVSAGDITHLRPESS